MSKTDRFVFIVLKIVAWIIFVGLCIEAGALLVNFGFSLYNPEFVKNLYQKIDLSEMYALNKWYYFSMYSFVLTIAVLKAILFYIVIELVTKLNLTKPFNRFVSTKIFQVSYYTFSIGIISYIARQSAKNLLQHGVKTDMLHPFWIDSQSFILMAALIYVIAIIFLKGVEYQEELEETV